MLLYPTAPMLGEGQQNTYWIWPLRMANEKAKCEASAYFCIYMALSGIYVLKILPTVAANKVSCQTNF
ncbi:hypothetical protein BDV32DRAFT_85943 [Aspergillus pseudonomiae]|nr:hypothetical protein BDV32DRAFT_85943 [Aspergillus pseudonomiae]